VRGAVVVEVPVSLPVLTPKAAKALLAILRGSNEQEPPDRTEDEETIPVVRQKKPT
jgi:hypothetical protein